MKYLLALFFVALLAPATPKECAPNKSQSKLLCYYSKLTDVNSCQCTHIILPHDADVKSIDRLRPNLGNAKILVTVHEFNEGLVNLLKKSKVDGLEVNLQKLESKNDLVDFISTVKERLGSDLYIAVSVPSRAEAVAKYYDFKALDKKTDLYVLQTSFLGANRNVTFHPSRLSGLWDMQNADSVVDLVSGLGTPLSKLVITSPVQAYQFTLQSSNHTAPGAPALDIASITRDELCNKMSKDNWVLERDQDQTGPYIFRDNKWIAFEDDMSIDIKAKYSRVRGLAGLALKDLTQDGGSKCGQTILEAAYNGLSRQSRAPRGAVLHSLEREILETPNRPLDTVQVSPYRISRVIDVEGKVHVIRQDTRTEFECSRQGYFVHPRSCGRFYRCVKFDQLSDEFNVFEFDCPAGLAFDSRVEVCVWPGSLPHGSACSGSSEIAPVPKERFVCPKEPGYYADPENCRWFFACLDHGKSPLTAYEFRCPFGLVFDQDRLLCEWPWLVPKCGSGSGSGVVYGFEQNQLNFYGSVSNQLKLDQYDGLGQLQSIKLGGLHGPIEQTQAKVYSSVGLDHSNLLSQNGFDENRQNYLSGLQNQEYLLLQGNGNDNQDILKTNINQNSYVNVGNQFASLNQGSGFKSEDLGHSNVQFSQGGKNAFSGNYGSKGQGISSQSFINHGDLSQNSGFSSGNLHLNQNFKTSGNFDNNDHTLEINHGISQQDNLHLINLNQNLKESNLGNIGHSVEINHGLSHQDNSHLFNGNGQQENINLYGLDHNAGDVTFNSNKDSSSNLNTGGGATSTFFGKQGGVKSEANFLTVGTGEQDTGKYHVQFETGNKNSGVKTNFADVNVALGGPTYENNDKLNFNEEGKKSVVYQANYLQPAGKLDIVGGGFSAVGTGNSASDFNKLININHDTSAKFISSDIPVVKTVPIPTVDTIESYHGGVVANIPQLQFKVHQTSHENAGKFDNSGAVSFQSQNIHNVPSTIGNINAYDTGKYNENLDAVTQKAVVFQTQNVHNVNSYDSGKYNQHLEGVTPKTVSFQTQNVHSYDTGKYNQNLDGGAQKTISFQTQNLHNDNSYDTGKYNQNLDGGAQKTISFQTQNLHNDNSYDTGKYNQNLDGGAQKTVSFQTQNLHNVNSYDTGKYNQNLDGGAQKTVFFQTQNLHNVNSYNTGKYNQNSEGGAQKIVSFQTQNIHTIPSGIGNSYETENNKNLVFGIKTEVPQVPIVTIQKQEEKVSSYQTPGAISTSFVQSNIDHSNVDYSLNLEKENQNINRGNVAFTKVLTPTVISTSHEQSIPVTHVQEHTKTVSQPVSFVHSSIDNSAQNVNFGLKYEHEGNQEITDNGKSFIQFQQVPQKVQVEHVTEHYNIAVEQRPNVIVEEQKLIKQQPIVSTYHTQHNIHEQQPKQQNVVLGHKFVQTGAVVESNIDVDKPRGFVTYTKSEQPLSTSSFKLEHPQQETYYQGPTISTVDVSNVNKNNVHVYSTPATVITEHHYSAPEVQVQTNKKLTTGNRGSYYYQNNVKSGGSTSTSQFTQHNSKPTFVTYTESEKPLQAIQYHQEIQVQTSPKPTVQNIFLGKNNEQQGQTYYFENKHTQFRPSSPRPFTSTSYPVREESLITFNEQPKLDIKTNHYVQHNEHKFIQSSEKPATYDFGTRYVSSTSRPVDVEYPKVQQVFSTNNYKENNNDNNQAHIYQYESHSVKPAVVSSFSISSYPKQSETIYQQEQEVPNTAQINVQHYNTYNQKYQENKVEIPIQTTHKTYEQNYQLNAQVNPIQTTYEHQATYEDNQDNQQQDKQFGLKYETPQFTLHQTGKDAVVTHSFNTNTKYNSENQNVEKKPDIVTFNNNLPVLTTYENKEPVNEVPFEKKYAYVTGNGYGEHNYNIQQTSERPFAYDNVEQRKEFVHRGPSYKFVQTDAIASPTPKYTYTYSSTTAKPQEYIAPVVSIHTEVENNNEKYENGYYFESSKSQGGGYSSSSSYSSTPRPTYKSTVATIIKNKLPKEQSELQFYDSRFSSTPRPVVSTTVTVPVKVASSTVKTIQGSRPISRYSFSSFDKEFEHNINVVPAVSTTAAPIISTEEYTYDVNTPKYDGFKVGKVVEQYSFDNAREQYYENEERNENEDVVVVKPVATRRPVVKVVKVKASPKPKSYVMTNDFHPLLPAKLGAQCTCTSNNLKIRTKPSSRGRSSSEKKSKLRIEITNEETSNNNDDDNENDNNDDNKTIVVENYEYDAKKEDKDENVYIESSTTSVPTSTSGVIYTIKKRVKVRPTTPAYEEVSTVKSRGRKTSVKVFKEIDSDDSDKQSYEEVSTVRIPLRKTSVKIYKEDDDSASDEEIGKAVRKGLSLVKSAVKEGVKEGVQEALEGKNFDRYGPGGWRARDETLQGTIDCQRAGLFRHPTHCNKFYACRWDCNKNRFTLHVFNCPVHLTFDNNLGACNWPSQGPACMGNTLLPSE